MYLVFLTGTGISIEADGDIVVQANSMSAIGSSSWEVPPTNKLGRIHVILTYVYPLDIVSQGPYQIMIVASEDQTKVKVELKGPWPFILSFNRTIYRPGDTIDIELNKYQVAQVSLLYSSWMQFRMYKPEMGTQRRTLIC